jgi:L-lactate utilization protein LutB
MKITKRQLRQIIKEEHQKLLKEGTIQTAVAAISKPLENLYNAYRYNILKTAPESMTLQAQAAQARANILKDLSRLISTFGDKK